MKIFSGSSNPKLAKKIAQKLSIKLSKIELSRFSNGECRVWIKDKVANEKVAVVQSFSNPPDEYLIEFCLICDALKRMGTKKILAVIPWFGYCIQDKVFREGEPLSSKVIAKLIQTLKINRILTLDLHNQTIAGFFDIPFTELFTTYTLIDYLKNKGPKIDTIISPDVGAVKKSIHFAESFNIPLVTISKKRNFNTGEVSIISVNEKIDGKSVLITDDFVSTGGTLMQTASFLKKQGVKKIYACLAHHFFVKGVEEKIEKSAINKIFITDTIQAPEKKYRKLQIISVAQKLAQNIKKYI